MPAKRYRVRLSAVEQQELKGLVSRGRAAAYKQTHARILLLSDEGQECGAMKDEEIARALRVGNATVGRVRRRCVEEGVEAALGRRQQVKPTPEETGRPRRSPPDGPDLLPTAGGPGRLDAATAGGPVGAVGDSGQHQH